MWKKFLLSCVAFLWATLCVAAPNQGIVLEAPIGVLIDGASGAVLYEKRAHTAVNPGDLVCLMTLYSALRLSQSRGIDQPVTIRYEDTQRSHSSRRIFLVAESQVPLKDLLHAVAVIGAEDAALAVARHFSASYSAFAEHMNRFAQEIGMRDSRFSFPVASFNQKSSAHDLALLARRLRHDFPQAFAWFSETTFSYNGHQQQNGNLSLWKNPHVNGVMAGTSNLDIITSWVRNDQQNAPRVLISTVLQGSNKEKTVDESVELLRRGWLDFETIKLFDSKAVITRLDVLKGNRNKLEVGCEEAVWASVPHQALVARGTGGFSVTIEYKSPILAPVKKGALIGSLLVHFENTLLASFPLIALHEIGPGNLLTRLVDSARIKKDEKKSKRMHFMTPIKNDDSRVAHTEQAHQESLLKFPTDFSIKIIGVNEVGFRQQVHQTISHVLPNFSVDSLQEAFSKTNKYIAFTAALYVHSQNELDAVYQAVTALPTVKFVL